MNDELCVARTCGHAGGMPIGAVATVEDAIAQIVDGAMRAFAPEVASEPLFVEMDPGTRVYLTADMHVESVARLYGDVSEVLGLEPGCSAPVGAGCLVCT